MTDHEADARARLATKEGRIEAITQRAYSRRFGNGNSNYIRECADDEYELLGFLADAEALAKECAEAMIAGSNKIILLVDALGIFGDGDDPLVQAALHNQEVVQGRLLTLGLRARDSKASSQCHPLPKAASILSAASSCIVRVTCE